MLKKMRRDLFEEDATMSKYHESQAVALDPGRFPSGRTRRVMATSIQRRRCHSRDPGSVVDMVSAFCGN